MTTIHVDPTATADDAPPTSRARRRRFSPRKSAMAAMGAVVAAGAAIPGTIATAQPAAAAGCSWKAVAWQDANIATIPWQGAPAFRLSWDGTVCTDGSRIQGYSLGTEHLHLTQYVFILSDWNMSAVANPGVVETGRDSKGITQIHVRYDIYTSVRPQSWECAIFPPVISLACSYGPAPSWVGDIDLWIDGAGNVGYQHFFSG